MAKNQKPYVCIIENKSQGNSFGDRTFMVSLEIRNPTTHEVLAAKTFQETACEGEHSAVKHLMVLDIKRWAKENNAKRFTGSF